MSYQRSLRIIRAIITYLVVFSLLSSPSYSGSRANAAPDAGKRQQGAAASVRLIKSDALEVDLDGDGQADAGDTLRYTITAQNTGSVDASGVTLTDVLEGNLTLLPGSLRSTPLALDQQIIAPEDSQPVAFTLTAADFDGDALSFTITTPPARGVLAGTAPSLTYQPTELNYSGTDSFTYQVCDAAAPPNCDAATVSVSIPPVNDAPSFTIGTPIQVFEDSGAITITGWATNMSAGPANESGQTLSFLVSNDYLGLFAVQPSVASDGTLTFTPAPNTAGTATLAVRLQDNGGTDLGGSDTSLALTTTLEVVAVNDAPSFNVGPSVTVGEDAGPQTHSGWATGVTAGPNEAGQALTFEILTNSNPSLFAAAPAVAANGTLTFQSAPNLSGTADLSLRLIDDGGTANGGVDNTAAQSFSIIVTAGNDAPVVNANTFGVEENSAANTSVGTVTYSDAEVEQGHTFSITGGNPSGAFSIDPVTGLIRVANPAVLDFETTPTFNLTVSVTDDGTTPATGSGTITINLTDANDAPVVTPASFNLPEDSDAADLVGTVNVDDQDTLQTHAFSITAGNAAGAFAINNLGQLTVANPAVLDFETTPTYTLTIQATDNGSPALSDTATVTVNLVNANEAPTVHSATFVIPEYSANNTFVGAVIVDDVETDEPYTYAITAGNTDGAFAIDSDGNITVANSGALVYRTNPTFSLTVEVTDSGTPPGTGSGTITVNVGNVNDAPVVTGGNFNVDENSDEGTSVGSASYTDADTGQTHAFSITGGNTGGAFAIDAASGEITVAGDLNYEALASYTLTVMVTDNGTPPAQGQATVTIAVNNVNESPVVGPASFSVAENSAIGASVGTLTVDDPETNQAHTFAITSGNTSGAFAITSLGQITVANPAVLNYEVTPSFLLMIEVTDSGDPATTVTVPLTINLSDVNEAPAIENDGFAVNENSAAGFEVGTLPVDEPDGGQTHTYTITGGNTGGAFAIDSDGLITVANTGVLNFEVTPSFILAVRVTDSGSPALSDTATVTITLIDVNEAPVIQGESYQAIGNTVLQVAAASSAPAPMVFFRGNLLANDGDPDAAYQLHTELGSASPGAVVTVTPTGEFTYLPPAGVTSDSFTYRVVDQFGLSTPATVTITLLSPVWYVKNDAVPGGLGRSTDPFDTLAEAQAASAPGNTIYVYYGDGTTTGQSAGIVLKSAQRLIGEGVALDVPAAVNGGPNPTPLLPAGQQPLISNDTPGGSGVLIANGGAEVRGLNIAASGSAIDATYAGASTGTLTVRNNTIRAAGAEGMDVNAGSTGQVTAVVRDNIIYSTGSGFDMQVTDGSALLDFSSNTVDSNATGVSVNGAVGALTVNGFANNVISGNASSSAVILASPVFDANPGGALDPLNLGSFLAGSLSNPVGGNGLMITNGQGDIRFTSLEIEADGGAGLRISGSTDAGSAGMRVAIDENHGRVAVARGPALHLTSLSIAAPNLIATSGASPYEGIYLASVSGQLSCMSCSIAFAQFEAFRIYGGDVDVTYGGSISQDTGQAVVISRWAGQSAHFTSSITSTNQGILLENNTGGTIAFTGLLDLDTQNTTAFTARDAGTVIVTGALNDLSAVAGTALSVRNTTIGVEGLTFRSIAALNAPVGIELVNTGSQGGLTVTGTGTAGTGGSIQNAASDGVRLSGTRNVTLNHLTISSSAASVSGSACGADLATNCSAAVDMYNAANVTLNGLAISGSRQMGISGYLVNGLTITNTDVFNAGNGSDEYALLLHNPSGAVLLEDSVLAEMADSGIRVYKYDSPVLNMTLRRATINGSDLVPGEDGLQFKLLNAPANILVEDSVFTHLSQDGIDGFYQGSAVLNLTADSNMFDSPVWNSGITLGGVDGGQAYLTLQGNTINNADDAGISLTSGQVARLDAQLANNIINHSAPLTNPSGVGIKLLQDENSTMTVSLDGNTIAPQAAGGVQASTGQLAASGSLHLTAFQNVIQAPGNPLTNGMVFDLPEAGHTYCLDVDDNDVSGSGIAGIQVANSAGVFQLEGTTGTLNAAAAAALINANNISTPPAAATANNGRVFTGVPDGACRNAVAAALPSAAQGAGGLDAVVKSPARGGGLARLLSPALQAAGETVQVNIGTLPAGKTVTFTFDVVIADPLPQGVYELSNQALLRGSNFTDVLSDDPATLDQDGDPTVTALYSTPTAVDDLIFASEDMPLALSAPGLLSNDAAAEGYSLTVASNTNPASGTLAVAADGSLTYTPAQDVNGDLTFTYLASDGERNSNPALVTLRIQPVNDAPVLDTSGSMRLNPVGAAQANNPGTLVRDLLASAGDRISDVDSAALEGIALTAANTTSGSWQFSTNGGLTWQDVGPLSSTAARLLVSDAETRLRFISTAGFLGTVDPAITFRAWDLTLGTNGTTEDVTTNGGTTAFSTAVETATIEVTPVADLVMVITPSENPSLAGNTLVYTLAVTNQGPSAAQAVRVTSAVPSGVNLVSVGSGCSEAGGAITCQQASLAAGATASFTVTVSIPTDFSGPLANAASATTTTVEADTTNNAAALTVMVNGQIEVIDPEDPIDPGDWSKPIIKEPDCGENFLGEFSNETVTLSLDNLPQHSQVTVEFDVVIIRSWDGNQITNDSLTEEQQQQMAALGVEVVGPDVWSMSADGQNLITTTFSNWDAYGFHQAYPGVFPGGDYPARTGARAINSRCYIYAGYSQDSIYHMRYSIPHSASTIELDFTASGLQPIDDESWGLDNISVRLSSGADLPPYLIYLPLIQR